MNDLSSQARLILHTLSVYADTGETWASVPELVTGSGIERSTLCRYLDELDVSGHIERCVTCDRSCLSHDGRRFLEDLAKDGDVKLVA